MGLLRAQSGITLLNNVEGVFQRVQLCRRLLLLRLDVLNASQQLLVFGELLLDCVLVLANTVTHRRDLFDRTIEGGDRLAHLNKQKHVL